MIFILEHIPDSNPDCIITYQAASIYKALHDFYCFLNMWAVVDVDEDELEILNFNGVNKDAIDKQRYDFQVARLTDQDLLEATNSIDQYVLNQINIGIIIAKEDSYNQYMEYQRHLADQGILILFIKILELIYFKTVPPAKRDHDLLGVQSAQELIEVEDTPEAIAKEMLDPLAEKMLRILYLLIKENEKSCSILTAYDNTIYMMLTKYNPKMVSKIFKEIYKRAQNISGGGGEESGNLAAGD